MRDGGESRLSAFDKGQRTLDFAEWPKSNRRANQYGEADVQSKAKGQIVIAARLEQRKRAFKIFARFGVLSGELVGYPANAIRNARLRGIGFPFDVAEEGRGVRPHRWQFASHVAADP